MPEMDCSNWTGKQKRQVGAQAVQHAGRWEEVEVNETGPARLKGKQGMRVRSAARVPHAKQRLLLSRSSSRRYFLNLVPSHQVCHPPGWQSQQGHAQAQGKMIVWLAASCHLMRTCMCDMCAAVGLPSRASLMHKMCVCIMCVRCTSLTLQPTTNGMIPRVMACQATYISLCCYFLLTTYDDASHHVPEHPALLSHSPSCDQVRQQATQL